MKHVVRALATLLLLSPAPLLAQASASSRWVDDEGCWCGYQTALKRPYVVRGRNATASEKQATADMLAEWNRYVDLFTVQVDSTSSLGSQNGVNEVNTYITSAEANVQYGFTMEPGLFGRAVLFPSAAFGRFNECRDYDPAGCGAYTETDVVINAGFSSGWTPDWFAPGNDQRGGLAMVQATVLHEVGHTLGLHHVFQLPGAGADSFSTMNYANDDAARWVTRIDSKTVRTQYPARANALLDVAVYPFVYGNNKYAQEYATLSKGSVTPGETFTVDRWTVQNVGSQAASNVVVTFYAWPKGSRQYPQPGDVVLGTASFSSAPVDTEGAFTGTPLAVPAGASAGDYFVGAVVTVNGSEDRAWQAGKPSNDRFVVGHDPRAVLRVLAGAGGTALAADFSYTPLAALAGQPVSFADASRGNPTAFSWSFGEPSSGGANTSTLRNPSHTFANPGSYTVTLSVSAGGPAVQAQRTIAVGGTPTTGGTSVQTLFVPIVLDVRGAGTSRFGSELTLANRGTTTATARLAYTAAAAIEGAAGSGTVTETIAPGRQLVVPDAIAYLRGKGLPIPGGGSNQGGTLRVTFEGLSSEDAGYAGVRTTTPSGSGRAGLSYPGLAPAQLLNGDSVLIGLRQDGADRSNLALANAGSAGTIRLKVYLVKGDGSEAAYLDPETELGPGQWTQLNAVLTAPDPDWADGWVYVERTSGSEPYAAYAVFNDNATNDGSYVPAVPVESVVAFGTVPVLVETPTFRSELVLSNLSDEPGYAFLEYFESAAAPGTSTGLFYVELAPLEQAVFPDVVDVLRQSGATIGPRGATYAGALDVAYSSDTSLLAGLSGARTGAPAPIGGQYGLFYPGLPGGESAVDAWVFGLQQSSQARSNLAIVNAGIFNDPIRVRLEVFDGATGQRTSERTIGPLAPGQWHQENGVLGGVANGYVHLTVVSGSDAFLAYGVVNDGASAASGTNDGSYVPMVVTQ